MVSSIQVNALTKTYIGIARVITSPVEIINTANPTQKAITEAIWDTGATNSVITKGLAAKLGLVASGQGLVKGVHGTKMVPVYPVKIILNNQNVSFILPVTECGRLTLYTHLVRKPLAHQPTLAEMTNAPVEVERSTNTVTVHDD